MKFMLKRTSNKMEDTVTLSRQEREKQGLLEVEVSYGGEADLHRHFDSCKKNPGHQNFIPVDQINVNHLPPGYQDNLLVDLVRALSDRTVRVSVKYVSDSRPKTFPGSDKRFPCYKDRGRDMLRTGTGWLYEVNIYPKKYDKIIYPKKYDKRYTTCECIECVNSPTPKTHFAHIRIVTAAHVVYDDLEAAHTTCHLFFDKGKSPEDCSSVVTLSGLSIEWCEVERDRCCVRYTTHDIKLAYTLKGIVEDWWNLSYSVYEKYEEIDLTQEHQVNCEDSDMAMTIIVSHPHGCSKQVSFGQFSRLEIREDHSIKHRYNTPTCPGSSGAYICMIGEGNGMVPISDYVHCGGGHDERGQQVNFSAYGESCHDLSQYFKTV